MNKEELTEREYKILTLLSKNYTNMQIAKEIYISIHTVKANISELFRKLNARTRTQAVVNAIKYGYINLDA